MKVWIDGKLKVDFKGKSNHPTQGIDQSLRYGLYNSSMSRYKNIFETNKMPQRIIFFDGVRSEKECEKLFNKSECKKLESQNVETYQVYSYRKKDKKFVPSRIIEVSKSFLK